MNHARRAGARPETRALAQAYERAKNGAATANTTIDVGRLLTDRDLIDDRERETERNHDPEAVAVELQRLRDQLTHGARGRRQRRRQRATRLGVAGACHGRDGTGVARMRLVAVATAATGTERERSWVDAHRPVIGADVAAGADGGLTAGYDLGAFFDEMFESPGRPRPHYRLLAERLSAMSASPARRADQGRQRLLPDAGHRVHGLRRRRRHRPHLPVRPRPPDRAGRRVGGDRARPRSSGSARSTSSSPTSTTASRSSRPGSCRPISSSARGTSGAR